MAKDQILAFHEDIENTIQFATRTSASSLINILQRMQHLKKKMNKLMVILKVLFWQLSNMIR